MGKNRKCYVPGCRGGYASQRKRNKELGLRNKSLFKPRNDAQRQKWCRAIPRLDRKFSERDVVCEDHFPEGAISRYTEIIMKDGSVVKWERGVPQLDPDAYPSIFPNCPKYLTRKVTVRKPPKKRQSTAVSHPRDTCGHVTLFDGLVLLAEEAGKKTQLDVLMGAEDPAELAPFDEPGEAAPSADPLFGLREIVDGIKGIPLPGPNWATAVVSNSAVFLSFGLKFQCEKTVVISESSNLLEVKVLFYGREVSIPEHKVLKLTDVSHLLHIVNGFQICAGLSAQAIDGEIHAAKCLGFVAHTPNRKCGRKPSILCVCCKVERKLLADRTRRREKVSNKTATSVRNALKICRIRATRLQCKVNKLKKQMEAMKRDCARMSEDVLHEQIASMPLSQQEAVKACFAAAKARGARGKRYTRDWVYECLLLRIKSRKAYEHIRTHEILALPCEATLQNYLHSVKGQYGFQEATFRCLKQKADELLEAARRGCLLIDEMKLSKGVAFDRGTLQIDGFTDLGDWTPRHQKNQRGDHALVMMFQPFRGRWVQALACFLSKGCASGTVLHHLILECIILLEDAGFHVDLVTTDGAQWNRSMWKHFGIDADNVSCGHPVSSSRRLWFASDFPHLVKNLRNFIVSHLETWTPDGVIKLRHWETVIMLDNAIGFKLKSNPKLTTAHVHPKAYQKMNVAKAFQFFDCKVAAAMELYKHRHENLEDCGPSTVFIRRVAGMLGAMNSRTPVGALMKNNQEWKNITEFLQYMKGWESVARKENYFFLSQNTALGFQVTLKATLELLEFLVGNCGFLFLMTARMNQDALERFFGLMRSACGSNDHPDPILFKQIFRLISTYSLIKPPKGSNVSGGDMLRTLLSVKDIEDRSSRLKEFQNILDTILDRGSLSEDIPLLVSHAFDHDLFPTNTDDFILSYFCGYVCRKGQRFTRCDACKDSVCFQGESTEERDFFLNEVNRGYLTKGSKRLFLLLKTMEDRIVEVLSSRVLDVDTLFHMASSLADVDSMPLVGCGEHCWQFTEAIVRFFLFTRVHFACRVANQADNIQQEKARLHRKSAKLY